MTSGPNEVFATFAYAIVNRGGILLGDGDGRAHVYQSEEQAHAVLLAMGDNGLFVTVVGVVPGPPDEDAP
jgi:hypothetical protein